MNIFVRSESCPILISYQLNVFASVANMVTTTGHCSSYHKRKEKHFGDALDTYLLYSKNSLNLRKGDVIHDLTIQLIH